MSNALTLFDNKNMPAHVSAFFETESNIAERQTVPSLAYGGKVWAISLNGETTKLVRKDDDGDLVPVSVMRVVILDYAKRRGRAYYEGDYNPEKPGRPLCWSDDGVKPDPSISDPAHTACDGCPMAVKGSKISANGKSVTACSQHRMVAVVPANDLEFTPLRLKLAITSDFDGQSPELEQQGWFAFSNYVDMLRSRGVQHTGALVTKMKFDPNTDYPKVIFSPDRWLSPDDLALVGSKSKGDDVAGLLRGTWTPTGADGEPVAKEAKASPATSKAADPVKTTTTAKKAASADDEDEPVKPKATNKKAKADDDGEVVLPKATPKKAKADDDGGEVVLPKATAKKAKADDEDEPAKPKGKPTAVAEIPADVEALLDEWGDE